MRFPVPADRLARHPNGNEREKEPRFSVWKAENACGIKST